MRAGGQHESQAKLNHVLLSQSTHTADLAATRPRITRPCPWLTATAGRLALPQTPAEQKLWSRLRNRQLNGFKFRRQHPIERFIIDFYCDEAKLCIEIDGDSHAEQIEYDQARTAYLNELGYTVIRFINREVFNQCEAATVQHIAEECERIVEDAAV
ncbi:hypothetical protein TFLX_00896 [Thermoflexales bacterium]|nr:hypothetical protein TFLX_00896 [Thermoflexales bacterium]